MGFDLEDLIWMHGIAVVSAAITLYFVKDFHQKRENFWPIVVLAITPVVNILVAALGAVIALITVAEIILMITTPDEPLP